jgi:MFS family permease
MTDVAQSRFDMLLVERFTPSIAGARPKMSDARSRPWPRVNLPSQLAPQFRSMAEGASTNTEPESRTRDARQKRSTQSKEARRRDAIKAISEETEMASATYDEPHAMSQSKKAAASGWIGSALEYYDFFIYATAASLVFPQIFFPSANPTTAIVASLATYGVGYVARPIGAFVLGHWGDTHGRKTVLIVCMFLMGFSTMAVGLLPTYQQVGVLAPVLLVILRLIQGFAVAGEISGASSMILEHAPFGRRGFYASFTLQGVQAGQILAAAVFLPLAHYMPEEAFNTWGWRIPFLLSFFVIIAGYIIRRNVDETPAFAEESEHGEVPKAPIIQAFKLSWRDMLRVVCMALMNVIPVVASIFGAAYAVQAAYGIGFQKDVYLWIPVLGNILAVLVIPYVGNLSDKIGRRPPIIVGALGSGLLAFGYLYAISIHSVPLAIVMSLLMWGVVYQGYNATFPSFYPELFQTRTRVSAMAISQNVGTTITALLPALFATVAPPGSTNIPLTIGAITFAITAIAAVAAWSARETYRIQIRDLGQPNAVPVDKLDYDRMRAAGSADARLARA